jgi:hypothetical protein
VAVAAAGGSVLAMADAARRRLRRRRSCREPAGDRILRGATRLPVLIRDGRGGRTIMRWGRNQGGGQTPLSWRWGSYQAST